MVVPLALTVLSCEALMARSVLSVHCAKTIASLYALKSVSSRGAISSALRRRLAASCTSLQRHERSRRA